MGHKGTIMKNGNHEKSRVIELVKDALDKHTPRRYPAEVLVEKRFVRKRRGRWFVPVFPSSDVPDRWKYYDILAQAEGEFDGTELKVMLIPPGLPEGVAES